MAEKRNIFLIGPMGAGKSTIGKYLSEMLHMDLYDSDQEIERRTGADIAWYSTLKVKRASVNGKNRSSVI